MLQSSHLQGVPLASGYASSSHANRTSNVSNFTPQQHAHNPAATAVPRIPQYEGGLTSTAGQSQPGWAHPPPKACQQAVACLLDCCHPYWSTCCRWVHHLLPQPARCAAAAAAASRWAGHLAIAARCCRTWLQLPQLQPPARAKSLKGSDPAAAVAVAAAAAAAAMVVWAGANCPS